MGKRYLRRSLLILVLPAVFLGAASVDNEEEGDYVVVMPVTGMVDDGIDVLLERVLREYDDAEALILRVDTPGGRVDSAIEITKKLMEAPIPTIAYVEGMGAISAGALISYACDDIIMTPDSNMGAATPVIAGPGGMQPTGEKEVSFLRARMRALAETNGHNPDIAEAMVDEDIELRARVREDGSLEIYSGEPADEPPSEEEQDNEEAPAPTLEETIERLIDQEDGDDGLQMSLSGALTPFMAAATAEEQVVLQAGKLLTVTGGGAERFGIIPKTVVSIDEALEHYGYEDLRRVEADFTWAESVFRFLTHPTMAGLLLMAGMGGIYFEVRSPGFGVPGMVGVTALALFFGARYIIGLADWIDVVLVVVGVILLAVEVFALPGFGVFGGAGILCILAGLYLALTNEPIPEYSWDFDRLREAGQTLLVAVVSYGVVGIAVLKFFPRTPMYRGLVLTHDMSNEAGYVVQAEPELREDSAIGMRGKALSMLRPAGRGRFGGKTYTVVTRGDFIDEGAPIEIVEVHGNRYVVEQVREDSE
ncbi:MAG: NfeD family protein [Candidatus Hydrogenedentota bacterium]